MTVFGRWWDDQDESDIVGIDRAKKRIVVAEVKCKELDARV